MDHFSWSDGIRAVLSPCLPCFRPSSPPADNEHRVRPELEGLLADIETDTEAETVSLHSNLGDRNRRKKKKRRNNKSISIFGYDLFGRPPIQLPESDDELEGGGRRRTRSGQLTVSSSTTLDSDAAPLDPATIDQLPNMQLRAAAEAEQRRQKEEKRARRRERKEMKKLAAALALESAEGGDFEGFPGSGSGGAHGNIPSPFMPGSSQGDSSHSGPSKSGRGDQPEFQADVDDEDADFGGDFYAKRATGNGSDRGSDSRSRTSASLSNSGDPARMYNHHYTSQCQSSPLAQEEFVHPGHEPLPKKKKKKSKSSSARDSASASSTSQSQSLPSPINSNFSESHPEIAAPSPMLAPGENRGGFPSAGFGVGPGGMRRKTSDMGVFLARRGDE
ncbi:hypothetical protein GLOTRDRAFT_94902 [Gloeophyllum trabeum ATCC 11539]|uniref:Uncharacterized protein n=1 Tax=Gloeophyllum trabeum (strain ATCC 11539 / FP-39264 / Madison 617) TaxID=670483 RepID=S7Q2Y4_GLOTA|nr:uncharacterized protein GLOTRDRAFT_94902 [Gloeophyllum trabeum ATCC 11539]EPQ53873.1 hypothetical protein GLOTRDRAFT_94902 [Gloeophyllum trabeum ATCC 11539]